MFRITAQIKVNAKENLVIEGEEMWQIFVTATPVEGKANGKVIDVISKHLHIAKSKIRIIRGLRSREKVIEIES